MRGSVWMLVSAAALSLAACSPKQSAAPAPAAPPAAAPAPAPPAPVAEAALPAAGAAPAPPPFHFSPGDFGAHERRVAALIANAETRDTLGETAGVTAESRYQRSRCPTKACVEKSYAAEEARLRKWEGSGDVK